MERKLKKVQKKDARRRLREAGIAAAPSPAVKRSGAALALVQKDDMQELYPLLSEAEVLVLAAPIYYFTLSAQIQAPIQRIYCMNKPGKLKKMALLASSYSPNVYDGAIGEYRGILNYWGVEDTGIVTAKIDEQKTDTTRNHILDLVGKLCSNA